ncbi:MAG: hypothetical protein WD061_01620 [Candidatus Saccharimonadales bacterium]
MSNNKSKTVLGDLLTKEMDRKQFLKHLGIGVLSISGISAALRNMTFESSSNKEQQPSGYGSSPYGK